MEKEINIADCGTWEIKGLSACCLEKKAVVHDVTLEKAIQVGCVMIGVKYNPAIKASWWDNNTIRYEDTDPWYVDVKKMVG